MDDFQEAITDVCTQALATYTARQQLNAATHPLTSDEYGYPTAHGLAIVQLQADALRGYAQVLVAIGGQPCISFTQTGGGYLLHQHTPAAVAYRQLLIAVVYAAAAGAVTYQDPAPAVTQKAA